MGHSFDEVQPDGVERRGSPRHGYERRVEAIRWQGEAEPLVWLGKDLSQTGLCITARPAPPLRSIVRLALYGRTREEPLLVRAEVVRREGDEVGLRFVDLAYDQLRALARMLAAAPAVEDLGVAASGRHVVELAAPTQPGFRAR